MGCTSQSWGGAKYRIANQCIFFKEGNVHSAAGGYRADQVKAYLMPNAVEIVYDVREVCDERKLHCCKHRAFQI